MLSVLKAYGTVFAFIALGNLLGRLFGPHKVSKPITKYLLYFSLPIAILDSITLEFDRLVSELKGLFYISLILVISSLLISYVLVRGKENGDIAVLCSANWNGLFLPIPILLILTDDWKSVTYAVAVTSGEILMLPVMILFISVVFGKERKLRAALRAMTFPFVPALLIALVLGAYGFKLRMLLPYDEFFYWNGKTMSYLALIVVGSLLKGKFAEKKEVLPVAITRFLISPVIGIPLAIMILSNPIAKLTIAIESIMPPAVINAAIAQELSMNSEATARITFTLTFASLFLVIIPVILFA